MEQVIGAFMYVEQRLAEPSSHAALATLFGTVGMNIDAGPAHNAYVFLTIVFGALAFFIKEGKPKTE